jgi:hypothetical protein
MKRLIAISLVVFSLFLVSTAQADVLFKRYFVGLWAGIDQNDGSEAQRSITLSSDGTFIIIGQEPYTLGCDGERGFVKATGQLVNGVIVSEDFKLFCFNGELPNGSRELRVEYKPNPFNGTLIESFPDIVEFIPSTLHKISK